MQGPNNSLPAAEPPYQLIAGLAGIGALLTAYLTIVSFQLISFVRPEMTFENCEMGSLKRTVRIATGSPLDWYRYCDLCRRCERGIWTLRMGCMRCMGCWSWRRVRLRGSGQRPEPRKIARANGRQGRRLRTSFNVDHRCCSPEAGARRRMGSQPGSTPLLRRVRSISYTSRSSSFGFWLKAKPHKHLAEAHTMQFVTSIHQYLFQGCVTPSNRLVGATEIPTSSYA